MITDILEQHAQEAAFLWSLRDLAAAGPHYRLADLAGLDERLEAHLDGLRVGGDEGVGIAAGASDAGEAGEVFVAAVLAAERGDADALQTIVDAAAPDPALRRALASALGWVPFATARPAIERLLAPSAPAAHRRLGVAASAAHREDPGEALAYAVLDDDIALRARALRAVGELGRGGLLREVRAQLHAADAGCRFWAAWSAALLGDPGAPAALWDIGGAGGPHAAAACAMAARRTEPHHARATLEALAASASSPVSPGRGRAAVIGAGALGDPASVPWLLERMREPALARLAGEAFTSLTGVAIERELEGERPAGWEAGPSDDPADPEVAMDPDERLPWPAPGAIERAWQARAGAMRRGVRYLLGEPLAPAPAERALREGTQRQRAAAAIELALLRPGRPLAEVRAPAARQALT